jgi:hypothetical protein
MRLRKEGAEEDEDPDQYQWHRQCGAEECVEMAERPNDNVPFRNMVSVKVDQDEDSLSDISFTTVSEGDCYVLYSYVVHQKVTRYLWDAS